MTYFSKDLDSVLRGRGLSTSPYDDPYLLRASEMFHVGILDVTKSQRRSAKRDLFERAFSGDGYDRSGNNESS